MSRRAFLKWLLALGVILIAWWAGVRKYFKGSDPNSRTDAPVTPSPSLDEAVLPDEIKAAGKPLLSMLILSDPHINSDLVEHSRRLKQALNDMQSMPHKVEALVISGDLTDDGRAKDYQELEKALKGYKLPPFYANMGNHDYYNIWIDKNDQFNKESMPNGKTDAQSREAFLKFMKQDKPYSDAWINGYHLIMLSQEAYIQEKPDVGEGAWYSDEQMAWFKQKMAEHKDGKPVFIMVHQPLPPIGQDGGTHRLIRAVEFRNILKPYRNVFVFSGHTHQDFRNGVPHYVKESFHWFQNSSVNRVLNRNYQNVAKDTSQGLYLYVYADKLMLRGRDFTNRTWIDEASWTIELIPVRS